MSKSASCDWFVIVIPTFRCAAARRWTSSYELDRCDHEEIWTILTWTSSYIPSGNLSVDFKLKPRYLLHPGSPFGLFILYNATLLAGGPSISARGSSSAGRPSVCGGKEACHGIGGGVRSHTAEKQALRRGGAKVWRT